MRGGLLNNKLFAPKVLVIARLLSNNTQLIMILRSGSLNEVGYAARLIRGIGIYAIKTSNYDNNLGNFLIFLDKIKIRQSDLAQRWAFWLGRCVQLFARSVPMRLLSNPYYHSYSTSWTKYQMRELSLTFARSK